MEQGHLSSGRRSMTHAVERSSYLRLPLLLQLQLLLLIELDLAHVLRRQSWRRSSP